MRKKDRPASWICSKGVISEIIFINSTDKPISNIWRIRYIKNYRSTCEIYYSGKLVDYRSVTITWIMTWLPEDTFLQANRGEIVNMNKVRYCKISENGLVLLMTGNKRVWLTTEKNIRKFYALVDYFPLIKGDRVRPTNMV